MRNSFSAPGDAAGAKDAVMVAGLDVSAFPSLGAAADRIIRRMTSGGGFAVAINAEKILRYRKDSVLRDDLAMADLRYPDGIGAVLAMRRKGVQSARIPGADLWLEVLRQAAERKIELRVALLGARPEVVEIVRSKLCSPPYEANVVISRDGYFDEGESSSVFSAISAEKPNLLFVAMGSPRQEIVIQKIREMCPAIYCLGVGGSFDVLAGRVRRAPQWAQKYGLEWFYRLVKQPKRILRQYKLMHFIWLLLINRI